MKKSNPSPETVSGTDQTHTRVAPHTNREPGNPIVKRPLGRPSKLQSGRAEKEGYTKILVDAGEIPETLGLGRRYYDEKESKLIYRELPVIRPEERPALLLEKLDELKQDEVSATHYWRLIFSVSFYLFRDQYNILLETSSRNRSEQIRKVNLKRMAELADIEYFNLSNLFIGQGSSRILLKYIAFLYTHKIDFIKIMFHPDLIERAYRGFLDRNTPVTTDGQSQE
jgi:hypothetical protein